METSKKKKTATAADLDIVKSEWIKTNGSEISTIVQQDDQADGKKRAVTVTKAAH